MPFPIQFDIIDAGDHTPFVAHLETEVERPGANHGRFPPSDVRSTVWYEPHLRRGTATDWSDYEPWQ